MGSPRTLKRRRQRHAYQAKIAAWRAEWQAMSPRQQLECKERRKQRGKLLEEVNRVMLGIYARHVEEFFSAEAPILTYLRTHR